jgi:hypothetical protein
MSRNPIESFTPGTTGSVVDRADLSASIQKELILQKMAGHGTVNDASPVGDQAAGGSACFASSGKDLIGHQSSATSVGLPDEIAIPPSSSIYEKSKTGSSNELHILNDGKADADAKAGTSSIHDAHTAIGLDAGAKLKAKHSSIKNNDEFLERDVKKVSGIRNDLEQQLTAHHIGTNTINSVKMDLNGSWATPAPLAYGAAHGTSISEKDSLKSADHKGQASPVPNGEQFTGTGPAVRLGNINDSPPVPAPEYQAIGPAIPLGNGDPSPVFLNPFIPAGSDKKSN